MSTSFFKRKNGGCLMSKFCAVSLKSDVSFWETAHPYLAMALARRILGTCVAVSCTKTYLG